MSNNTASGALSELFIDATREVIEKGRLKAQMVRLERVMTADKLQIKKIYAEIGKMYVDNTLKKNSARLEYLYKALDHLKLRIERAQARVDMLKTAHSVDECTEAFRAELSSKIKFTQDTAVSTAYVVKRRAQDIAASLRETAESLKNKAIEAAQNIANKTTAEYELEETPADFAELIASLEDEEEQVNDILSKLDLTLKELEDDFTEDKADLHKLIVDLENEEKQANEIIAKIQDTLDKVDEDPTEDSSSEDTAEDSESAGKFDF